MFALTVLQLIQFFSAQGTGTLDEIKILAQQVFDTHSIVEDDGIVICFGFVFVSEDAFLTVI